MGFLFLLLITLGQIFVVAMFIDLIRYHNKQEDSFYLWGLILVCLNILGALVYYFSVKPDLVWVKSVFRLPEAEAPITRWKCEKCGTLMTSEHLKCWKCGP